MKFTKIVSVYLLPITVLTIIVIKEINGQECGVRYSSKVQQRNIALTEKSSKVNERCLNVVKNPTPLRNVFEPNKNGSKVSKTEVEGRVVGGKLAIPGDFPWLVSVQRDGAHFCAGSIINPNWILTASHCYKDRESEIENLSVVTGATEFKKGDKYSVKEIITHESFQFVHYSNDVALLHLTKSIVYKHGNHGVGAVGPICLPSEESEFLGSATVAGWGYLYNGAGIASNKLMAVDVNILEPEHCVKAYRIFNELTMICAGYVEGGKDACQGDSGGALVAISKDRAVIVGIVSYGEGCAMRSKPGVYTRLTKYIGWIDDQVNQRDGGSVVDDNK